jgi:murein DD-endopeptidase MepM/ murein hydrolase activator NlpD
MDNRHLTVQLMCLGIRVIFCLMAAIILSGCVGLIIPPYGFVASDSQKVRKEDRDCIIPKNAPSISQGYNPQFAETEKEKSILGHHGIDIIEKKGTPVIACADGVVIRSSYGPFYGNQIIIDHGKIPGGLFIRSKYLHFSKRLVNEGNTIVRGQQIGTMGRTGLLGGFSHLHYEIQVSDQLDPSHFHSTNPHRFWADGVGIVTCFDKHRHWQDRPFRTTYPVPCLGVDWR